MRTQCCRVSFLSLCHEGRGICLRWIDFFRIFITLS